MKPLMRWAGGKRQLLKQLVDRLPKNYGCYYEPFLGCGALLLHLQPERAVVGDINSKLINLWLQVKNNLDVLLQEVSWFNRKNCTKEYYIKVRTEHNLLKDNHSIAAAASMLWLNAHCFNGLYRLDTKGNFNVPWDKRESIRIPDISNLKEISAYLTKVDIATRNYKDTCFSVKEGDFVYFDPPYDPASKTSRFTSYTGEEFTKKDQEELAHFFDYLTERNVFAMLSNNDTPLVRSLYASYRIDSIEARRSINNDGTKRKGMEVIITNY